VSPQAKSDVRIVVPATSANLGAGFDVFAMALPLFLTLDVSWADAGCRAVTFSSGRASELHRDGAEMAQTAIEAGLRLSGVADVGYSITIRSDIPLARGMGSSAALRVACLLAGGSLGEAVPQAAIIAEAARLEGHADNCVAALLGGFVIVVGETDDLFHVRIPLPEELIVSAAVPEQPILTQFSRNTLPQSVPLNHAVYNLGRSALFVAAIQQGNFDLLREAMKDKLHQRERLKSIPGAEVAIESALSAGAKGAALSGSGPTVIALCDRRDGRGKEVSLAMREAFASAGMHASSFVFAPERRGAHIES